MREKLEQTNEERRRKQNDRHCLLFKHWIIMWNRKKPIQWDIEGWIRTDKNKMRTLVETIKKYRTKLNAQRFTFSYSHTKNYSNLSHNGLCSVAPYIKYIYTKMCGLFVQHLVGIQCRVSRSKSKGKFVFL